MFWALGEGETRALAAGGGRCHGAQPSLHIHENMTTAARPMPRFPYKDPAEEMEALHHVMRARRLLTTPPPATLDNYSWAVAWRDGKDKLHTALFTDVDDAKRWFAHLYVAAGKLMALTVVDVAYELVRLSRGPQQPQPPALGWVHPHHWEQGFWEGMLLSRAQYEDFRRFRAAKAAASLVHL